MEAHYLGMCKNSTNNAFGSPSTPRYSIKGMAIRVADKDGVKVLSLENINKADQISSSNSSKTLSRRNKSRANLKDVIILHTCEEKSQSHYSQTPKGKKSAFYLQKQRNVDLQGLSKDQSTKSRMSSPSAATSVSTKAKSINEKQTVQETDEEKRNRTTKYIKNTLAKIGLVYQDQIDQPKEKRILKIHKNKLVNV